MTIQDRVFNFRSLIKFSYLAKGNPLQPQKTSFFAITYGSSVIFFLLFNLFKRKKNDQKKLAFFLLGLFVITVRKKINIKITTQQRAKRLKKM